MSPAVELKLPVRMRIGDGEEFEVGSMHFDLVSETADPEPLEVKAQLAAMLRSAADEVEARENGTDS